MVWTSGEDGQRLQTDKGCRRWSCYAGGKEEDYRDGLQLLVSLVYRTGSLSAGEPTFNLDDLKLRKAKSEFTELICNTPDVI